MKAINLYFNAKITNDSAVASRTVKPVYTLRSIVDSNDKLNVLLLSIKSMSALRFSKAVFNIEVDDFFAESTATIFKCIKDAFPDSELKLSSKRANTLQAWTDEVKELANFFGPDDPVLCVFNHDHIFVDHEPAFFIDEVCSYLSRVRNGFFIYSHHPEAISATNFTEGYRYRLAKLYNNKIPLNDYKLDSSCFYFSQTMGWIDGIFVTTISGLDYMWNSLKFSGQYMGRPDWPGVDFGGAVFEIACGSREYFRHFDGYNHISDLSDLFGMNFNDFDSDGVLATSKKLNTYLKDKSKQYSEISQCYFTIFKRNYTLAMRDWTFYAMNNPVKFSQKYMFNRLVERFGRAYIDKDVSYFNIDESDKNAIAKHFYNTCYLNYVSIQTEVYIDAYGNLENFSPLKL